jgi:hypothetical protein
VGSVINGGTFVVPPALGNKIIHPFSDFLLHDIGTGDGIVETNGELTRNKIRTAPLWGLRTRDKLMHDGGSSSPPTNSGAQSFTFNEAILRHAGQASSSRTAYQALTTLQKGNSSGSSNRCNENEELDNSPGRVYSRPRDFGPSHCTTAKPLDNKLPSAYSEVAREPLNNERQ